MRASFVNTASPDQVQIMTTSIQSQDLEHSRDDRGPAGEASGTPVSTVARAQAATRRHECIAVAAYQRAERRGFAPGGELDDWLRAEQELDAAR
jgi:hypothetical protein